MTAAVATRTVTRTPRNAPARQHQGRVQARPRLRVLDRAVARRRTRRRNLAVVGILVVVGALFAVAFVQARLVENQRQLDLMRGQITDLEAERANLERAIDEASSPALIVDRATEELGMVRAVDPVYLVAVTPEGLSDAGPVAATPVASEGVSDVAATDPTVEPGVLNSAALGGDPDR